MQRSSHKQSSSSTNTSPPYPHITTPQLVDDNSLPPHNYNSHNTPLNYPSPRHSQLPVIPSPPYLYNPHSYDDTIFDNSSNTSPIHKI